MPITQIFPGSSAGAERKGTFVMMNQTTLKQHLASLAFLVFSVILLTALLTGRPARRAGTVDLTQTATAGWYEETGSGKWVYHAA